ncbi:MAG: hypothetical protein K1000chlam4_00061 [Chlamydiae bacterium]|nr:hypothetical protein [Chlamydiota bacterium]
MNNLGENQFFSMYFWREGRPPPPMEHGSILIMRDGDIVKNSLTHIAISLGQLVKDRVFREAPLKYAYTSSMHSAVLVGHRYEDETPVLELAEAQIQGVSKNWVKLTQLGKSRQATMFYQFVPKAPKVRDALLDLAFHSSSNLDEKMSYGFKNAAISLFKAASEFDSQARDKIACAVVDTLQGRQWRDLSGSIFSEYCSSYVILLLQASCVLAQIPADQIAEIKRAPPDNAIRFVAYCHVDRALPKQLKCNSDSVQPSELYDRFLSFPT